MTSFDLLSIILSGLALITSGIVAQRQLSASRNSDSTLVLLELLKEYRSPEMLADRARVIRHLDSGRFELSGGFRGLPDEMRISVERVSHFFDQVGLLVSHRLAPADALVTFFGVGAMQFWQRLYPYLSAERDLRGSKRYQLYFEIFVDLSKRRDPERLLARIQRRMNSGTGAGALWSSFYRTSLLLRVQLTSRAALRSRHNARKLAGLVGAGTPEDD